MQKITIICVGKLKEAYFTDACAEYQKRLSRFCALRIVELPEERLPAAPSPGEIERALLAEARRVEAKLPPGKLAALCVEGELIDSEAFAGALLAAGPSVTFLIGGSRGLHESLKRRADWRLSLSRMTFPHHLARVMLLEQLYRASQIHAHTKYHK